MARFVLAGGQVVEARAGGDLERVYRAMGAKPDYGNPPADTSQGADDTGSEETADPSSSGQ